MKNFSRTLFAFMLALGAAPFLTGCGGDEGGKTADEVKAQSGSVGAVKSVANVVQSTSSRQNLGRIQGQAGQRGGTQGDKVSGARGASGGGQPVPGGVRGASLRHAKSAARKAAKRSHSIDPLYDFKDAATGESYMDRCLHPQGATGTGVYVHETIFESKELKSTSRIETGVVGRADCDLIGKFEGTKTGGASCEVTLGELDQYYETGGTLPASGCTPLHKDKNGKTCDPFTAAEDLICSAVDANEWDDPVKSDFNDLRKSLDVLEYKDGSSTFTSETTVTETGLKYKMVEKFAAAKPTDEFKSSESTTDVEVRGTAEDFIVGIVLDDLLWNALDALCQEAPTNTIIRGACASLNEAGAAWDRGDVDASDDTINDLVDTLCSNVAKVTKDLPSAKDFCDVWTTDEEDVIVKSVEKTAWTDGTSAETTWTPKTPCVTLDEEAANHCDKIDGTEKTVTTLPAADPGGVKTITETNAWTFAGTKGTDSHSEVVDYVNGEKWTVSSSDAYDCLNTECDKSKGSGKYTDDWVFAGGREATCGAYTWDDAKGDDFGTYTDVEQYANGSVKEESGETKDAFTGSYNFKTFDKGTADCASSPPKAVQAADGKQTDGYTESWSRKDGIQIKLGPNQVATRSGALIKFTDLTKASGEYVSAAACQDPAEDNKAQQGEDFSNPAALGATCSVVNEGSGDEPSGDKYTFREQKAATGASEVEFTWKSADGTQSASGKFTVDPRGVTKGELTEAGIAYSVTLNKDGSGEFCEKGKPPEEGCAKLNPGDFVL